MARSIILDSLSYKERVKLLKKQIELFEELSVLESYFKPLREVKNLYMIEVRRICALELEKKGLSYAEIARVFGTTYKVAVRAINNPKVEHAFQVAKKNYKKWVKEKVYPVTIDGRRYDPLVTNKDNVTRPFIVKPISKYAKENVSAVYSYGLCG